MSDTEQQFWDLTEELIETANQKAAEQDTAMISDAMLYAAARFGAYASAVATAERKEFKEDQAEIKAMLMEQFEAMLDANLADYLENYKVYLDR
jgi:flagellar biosynthesis/type III secretory pathway protein FliH